MKREASVYGSIAANTSRRILKYFVRIGIAVGTITAIVAVLAGLVYLLALGM